ncbi:hypothetical protein CEXT_66121 [Caerostris extrusa]|uniref:Uncharacterized protein n=1 Tax=Caerostris extrusa TaxID=172846 RepID=A0AAV4TZ41_CAEEX|nr:hypothetical protein CEXT_66121 [Caerostris extrusa]
MLVVSSEIFYELKTIVNREDCDGFAIMEAAATTDSLKHYRKLDYVLPALPRSRQIASGIIFLEWPLPVQVTLQGPLRFLLQSFEARTSELGLGQFSC